MRKPSLPSLDDTGKYSDRLFKFLKSPSVRFNGDFRVFQMGKMSNRNTLRDTLVPSEILIGSTSGSDTVFGCSLRSILNGGRRPIYAYARVPFGIVEITDVFWDRYISIGRCAWDAAHNIHHDKRYEYLADGRQRRCLWCGEVFEVQKRTKIEVTEWEVWTPYKDNVPAKIRTESGSMGELIEELV